MELKKKIYVSEQKFTEEIDKFIYGGYADAIFRSPEGAYVKPHGQNDFIPVEDWKNKYRFSGGRTLEHLAKWFYEKGLRDGLDQKINTEMEKFTMEFIKRGQTAK